MRASRPLLQPDKFFHGQLIEGTDVHNVRWLRPDAQVMQTEDWTAVQGGCIALMLNGKKQRAVLLLFNPTAESVGFQLPVEQAPAKWRVLLETGEGRFEPDEPAVASGETFNVAGRSVIVLEGMEILR